MRVRVTPQYFEGQKLSDRQKADGPKLYGMLELTGESGRQAVELGNSAGGEAWLDCNVHVTACSLYCNANGQEKSLPRRPSQVALAGCVQALTGGVIIVSSVSFGRAAVPGLNGVCRRADF